MSEAEENLIARPTRVPTPPNDDRLTLADAGFRRSRTSRGKSSGSTTQCSTSACNRSPAQGVTGDRARTPSTATRWPRLLNGEVQTHLFRVRAAHDSCLTRVDPGNIPAEVYNNLVDGERESAAAASLHDAAAGLKLADGVHDFDLYCPSPRSRSWITRMRMA